MSSLTLRPIQRTDDRLLSTRNCVEIYKDSEEAQRDLHKGVPVDLSRLNGSCRTWFHRLKNKCTCYWAEVQTNVAVEVEIHSKLSQLSAFKHKKTTWKQIKSMNDEHNPQMVPTPILGSGGIKRKTSGSEGVNWETDRAFKIVLQSLWMYACLRLIKTQWIWLSKRNTLESFQEKRLRTPKPTSKSNIESNLISKSKTDCAKRRENS